MNRDYELPREYLQNGEVMEFDFEQNEKDFIVDEIPLVEEHEKTLETKEIS